MDAEAQKRAAAARALDMVQGGMRLGLGTGSTAKHFVELLGERVRAGLDIVAVPTSEMTRAQAAAAGISLTTLDETPELDLTIDGADEIAPDLTLIKGGGGALLREKIVAAASARMIVIADESKWVSMLGSFPLPIEIAPFGATAIYRAVEAAAAEAGCPGPAVLRKSKGRSRFRHRRRSLAARCEIAAHSRSAGAGGSALQGSRRNGARSVHRSGAGCYRRRT